MLIFHHEKFKEKNKLNPKHADEGNNIREKLNEI